MGKAADGTSTGDFALKILSTIKPVEVYGLGAGTYKAAKGFHQHVGARETAWFYIRRKHPSLLKDFEAAADLYAVEVDPAWTKTREYRIEDFYL